MTMARNLTLTASMGLAAILGSCSDPVPPAAQGAASIDLGPPSIDAAGLGAKCSNQHWINVPYNANTKGYVTSASSAPSRAIDGENGATVACSVKQSGASYAVNGSLFSSANNGMVEISFQITPGQDATGVLTVSDADTVSSYTLDSARVGSSKCTVSVTPAAGEGLGIAPGRVWAKVWCTDLAIYGSPGSICSVPNSYVVLENCDK